MSMYSEMIARFRDPAISNRSLDITEKRRVVILAALQIADANVIDALIELLQYNGGWDLKDENHPIVKARRALERAGVKL